MGCLARYDAALFSSFLVTPVFQPDLTMENAVRFSRFDRNAPLATCSAHPIVLEDRHWPSCEHYFCYHVLRSESKAEALMAQSDPLEVHAQTRPWYRRKKKNWKTLRNVLMTRALYTKVQMYEDVREALLETGDNLIIESSLYDYYWGIGRDARGLNQLGRIWMEIRSKVSAS